MNQKGVAPILILVAVIGIVAFLALASSAPFKNNLLSSLFPKDTSHAAGNWAFEENFDAEGAPTAPVPYSDPSKFQFVVSSNDVDGIIDGQTVAGADEQIVRPTPPIDMGHGPHCEPPIGNTDPALNNHQMSPNNFSEIEFQNLLRPQLIYICNQHMMTNIKSGYGLISIMPRQYFDFAGRTGTIEFDNNAYAFGREWFDMYLVPEQDMLQSMASLSEGGTLEQTPRTAVKFSFKDATPQMYFIENYDNNDATSRFWRSGYRFTNAFPNDPAPNNPKTRRTYRFQISQTSWKYQIQIDPVTSPVNAPNGSYETIDGKTFWTFSGNFPKTLSFSKALIRFEHHSYNPTKDGISGTPWSQFTYHWDNIHFDGPVLPAHTAFDPTTNPFIKMWFSAPGTVSPPMHFNVNVPATDIKNPRIIGEVASSLNRGEVDFANTSHWRQFRVNGGAWQDSTLVKNVDCGCDRTWSTFRNSINGLVSGDNTIEFKYANRPPGKTWQPDGFNIKDVEIQIDPVGYVLPSSTPLPSQAPIPSPSPVPSPSPLPSPTPIPSGAITVDFNAKAAGALSGEYPTGLLSWGANWITSSPFGQFTTNSISFSGAAITQSTFNIVLANRSLVSLQAYNGGAGASTITLSCAGNVTKTQSVAAASLATITTGWTNPCSTITIASSNGWSTNFDNLALSAVLTTALPSPSAQPSIPPSPTPQASVKPGDIDGNNKVDIFDYNTLLSNFGKTGSGLPGDFDNNGKVDIFDFNVLLTNFGK